MNQKSKNNFPGEFFCNYVFILGHFYIMRSTVYVDTHLYDKGFFFFLEHLHFFSAVILSFFSAADVIGSDIQNGILFNVTLVL